MLPLTQSLCVNKAKRFVQTYRLLLQFSLIFVVKCKCKREHYHRIHTFLKSDALYKSVSDSTCGSSAVGYLDPLLTHLTVQEGVDVSVLYL